MFPTLIDGTICETKHIERYLNDCTAHTTWAVFYSHILYAYMGNMFIFVP